MISLFVKPACKVGIKIAIAAGAGATAVVCGYIVYKKVRKLKNHSSDVEDVDITNAEINKSVEEFDTETTTTDFEDSQIREFICFLSKRGIEYDNVVDIAKTIDDVRIKLPENFDCVKARMLDIINNDSDIDDIQELYTEVYHMLYTEESDVSNETTDSDDATEALNEINTIEEVETHD